MISQRIELIRGDITVLQVDAIVNAANSRLRGGGGVDGAIHRAAGPELLEECIGLGGCPTGEARITKGYQLPAKYVIHTVGPVFYKDPVKAIGLLRSCYLSSLNLAVENACRTIAFPNISTGVYGYPKEEAAMIAVKAVRDFLQMDSFLDKVIFVCFDDENYSIYHRLIGK
jgi:O-acetyl-ADP-ribose deacetylase (regulator of RNase III)